MTPEQKTVVVKLLREWTETELAGEPVYSKSGEYEWLTPRGEWVAGMEWEFEGDELVLKARV